MKWPAPPDKWGKITGILAICALLFGSGGFYAGWKATVSQEAIDHEALWKHLAETAPVWTAVQQSAVINARQDAQMEELRRSIGDVTELVRQQSLNFGRMIDLVSQQQRNRGGQQ